MITLTISAVILYVYVLWKTNRGSFLLSPSAIHLVYLALYVLVPSIVLYTSGVEHSFGGKDSYYIGEKAVLLILLATVGLTLGTSITGRGKDTPVMLMRDLQQRGFAIFLLISIGLSSAFVVKNFDLFHDINSLKALDDPAHYANIQHLKMEVLFGSTYLLQGVNHIIPLIVLFYLAKHYCGDNKKYWYMAVGLLVFDVAFEIQCGNSWVGFALPVMAVMLRQYFRPASIKQILAVALVLFMFLGGLLFIKFGRSSLESDDEGTLLLVGLTAHRFSSGAATLQLILETYPKERDYEYGLTYFGDAVSLIPSPIKRTFVPENWWGGFNGFISDYIGFYGGTGQIPIMGEFYANFGMGGVLLGSVFYGMLLQRITNALRTHSVTKASTVVFVVVLGYRLAEATVEGIGGRFIVSCLWIAIFFAYYEMRSFGHVGSSQCRVAVADGVNG